MKKFLKDKSVLVTAGPTREAIDIVRYISNRSSGKMGWCLANACRDMGADVTLVSGPTNLAKPHDIKLIKVETCLEMLKAIESNIRGADILIMAAAPGDFTPHKKIKEKIKRGHGPISIMLKPTPDILKAISNKKGLKKNLIRVGFAAEAGFPVSRAYKKLKEKKLDFIIANDISKKDTGFESGYNKVYIIKKDGTFIKTGRLRKKILAKKILLSILDKERIKC